MLPGVGVFGTGSSARVLVPLLRAEGFSIQALWGKTEEEAKQLAEEMNISFYTSRTDDVLLHQDVDLVCINIPPPLTRQIAVKALGTTFFQLIWISFTCGLNSSLFLWLDSDCDLVSVAEELRV